MQKITPNSKLAISPKPRIYIFFRQLPITQISLPKKQLFKRQITLQSL